MGNEVTHRTAGLRLTDAHFSFKLSDWRGASQAGPSFRRTPLHQRYPSQPAAAAAAAAEVAATVLCSRRACLRIVKTDGEGEWRGLVVSNQVLKHPSTLRFQISILLGPVNYDPGNDKSQIK